MRAFILLLYFVLPKLSAADCFLDQEEVTANSLTNKHKFQVKVDVDTFDAMLGVQVEAPRVIDGNQMTGFSLSREGSPAGGYILPLSVKPENQSMTSSFVADHRLLEGATISFSYGGCSTYSYQFHDWLDVEK